MGILDEAIREHLELKRKHGAEQQELLELEDDAFGPAKRPGAEQEPGQAGSDAGEREVDPEAEEPTAIAHKLPEQAQEPETVVAPTEPPSADPVEPELAQAPEPEVAEADETPEPEAATRPTEPEAGEPDAKESGASFETTEREAIAEQPTEVFDVAGELASDPGEAASQAEGPAAAEPVVEEEEAAEEEAAAAPETGEEIFDESSLSEELDQALGGTEQSEQRRTAFFEEESDEYRTPQRPSRQTTSREGSAPDPETGEEDVLEETPEFLEETPEHDRLWFEQKPPKDFDFND